MTNQLHPSVENIFHLLFWQFLYFSHSTSSHCWWWYCIQLESFRSVSTAAESGGMQSMHLLMPLMDATRMEPMVSGFYLLLRILYFLSYMYGDTKVDDNTTIAGIFIILFFLFALCHPYKKNLCNTLDSLLLLFISLQYVNNFFQSVLNLVASVLFLLYFVVYILSKTLLKVQCRCFLRLKSFVDRMIDEQIVQTNREDGQGGDLPDRLVNPEGYRFLSEPPTQRGDQNSCPNAHPVATYGFV